MGSMLAGGLVVAAVLLARTAIVGAQSRSDPDLAGLTAARQPTHVVAGAQPSGQMSSPVAASSATPSASANGRAHIAHTEGQGVVLRASPREEDRTPRGFMDGDVVTVLERQGSDWARVRGDNGQEGWVPAAYLGP